MTDRDLVQAAAAWHRHADGLFRTLLDAEERPEF